VRGLFTAAHQAAGIEDRPTNDLLDTPDTGFGYELSKFQKLVFDGIKNHRSKAQLLRAKLLLPSDQRRKSHVQRHDDKFSNTILN
jgi:hypothetical protein